MELTFKGFGFCVELKVGRIQIHSESRDVDMQSARVESVSQDDMGITPIGFNR